MISTIQPAMNPDRVRVPAEGNRRRIAMRFTAFGIAIVMALAGCNGTVSAERSRGGDAANSTQTASDEPRGESASHSLPPSIQRALRNLEAQPGLNPSTLLVLHYLRRWYGFAAFPDLIDRYRVDMQNSYAAGLPDDRQSSYLRIMRRIINPERMPVSNDARWEDFASAMFAKGGINVITIPALYCDQIPYPTDYAAILVSGRDMGGYELTHVGMALRWIDENGCTLPMNADFEPSVARAIADLVDPTNGATDLEMEATAFLMYMGRRDLVRADMLVAIEAAQRPNGGWSLDSSDESLAASWHPTAMGLWALLGQHRPEVEMSPMLMPR